jgi:hypothetical protein
LRPKLTQNYAHRTFGFVVVEVVVVDEVVVVVEVVAVGEVVVVKA